MKINFSFTLAFRDVASHAAQRIRPVLAAHSAMFVMFCSGGVHWMDAREIINRRRKDDVHDHKINSRAQTPRQATQPTHWVSSSVTISQRTQSMCSTRMAGLKRCADTAIRFVTTVTDNGVKPIVCCSRNKEHRLTADKWFTWFRSAHR